MADEVRELRESITKLTKKVDDLAVLSRQVTELTEGMKLIREILMRMDQSSSKKNDDHKDAGKSHSEAETDSNDDAGRGMMKFRKLELPVFDGDDPIGWFCRVERYFHINGVSESDKLEAVGVCLEDRALHWYQWKETRSALKSWLEFKLKVLERFHTFQRGGDYKILFSNQQEGSVLEYVEEFEKLSFSLTDVPEECLMGAFLYGLKTQIQAELEIADESDLEGLIRMALGVDGQNQLLESKKGNRANAAVLNPGLKRYPTQQLYSRVTHNPDPTRFIPAPTSITHGSKFDPQTLDSKSNSTSTMASCSRKNRWSRRLPDSEMARRRELELCFKCGEKYSPTHTCKEKHLQVFLIDVETDHGGTKMDEEKDGVADYLDVEDEATRTELSSNSLIGIESHCTMKTKEENR